MNDLKAILKAFHFVFGLFLSMLLFIAFMSIAFYDDSLFVPKVEFVPLGVVSHYMVLVKPSPPKQ
jgi:hypothetical protein